MITFKSTHYVGDAKCEQLSLLPSKESFIEAITKIDSSYAIFEAKYEDKDILLSFAPISRILLRKIIITPRFKELISLLDGKKEITKDFEATLDIELFDIAQEFCKECFVASWGEGFTPLGLANWKDTQSRLTLILLGYAEDIKKKTGQE